ncbi:hypothetical protein C8A05DRAFT_15491, partial [Staphylotrichum tortipilum]
LPPSSSSSSCSRHYIDRTMDISVSVIGKGPISLPLKRDVPIHIAVTIPFSLLMTDFDPNTTPVPQMERPRFWLGTLLFGRRYEPPRYASSKAQFLTNPILCDRVWPKLSTILFGQEERFLYSHMTSDAREWEKIGTANIFWVCATGITDDDISNVRAVVLTASPGLDGTGEGVLFTVEEIGQTEKAAWKRAWTAMPAWTADLGESDADLAMERKNGALCRLKAGFVELPLSGEKE